MKISKRCIILIIISFWLLIGNLNAWATVGFVVKEIRIEGLQGISRGTVLSYLPIKVGEVLTESKSAEILQALYTTGLFTDVSLAHEGNILIIKVGEQSVISSVKVNGNENIKKEDLDKILKDNGLTTGNIFSRAALEKVQRELQAQYDNLGYYNVKIDLKTSNLDRNRIAIIIDINEGKIAKIREIKIIGNKAFTADEIRKQFLVSTPNLFTLITKKDQYSKQKMQASLEAVRSYYMDRGYIHFRIVDVQVQLRNNNTGVYIAVTVSEGDKYTFSGFRVEGNTVMPQEDIIKVIPIKRGEVFSRKAIEQANENIGLMLGKKGYSFAQIDPIPNINEETKQVFLTFHIVPGSQVYVRRITFVGNTYTTDEVLRRAMQQPEGALLSTGRVRESVRQLNLLGFFSDVQVKTTPVPGTNNQVDVEYKVVETPSGSATFSLGYGSLGWEIGAGINQPNFLGTGRSVGLNFSKTRFATGYSFSYYNPFYTTNNIGRGVNVYYTKTTPGDVNLANYQFDSYGGNVFYNIPITLNDRLTLGYGYKHIVLSIGDRASKEINNFVAQNGNVFDIFLLDGGWQHIGQDRAIFPTKGLNIFLTTQVALPVFSKRLDYYKVSASADWFYPLNEKRTFLVEIFGGAGYGYGYGNTQGLPFFLNYYAGGLSEGLVRGFETNTLGPRDSKFQPIGGNFLAHATIGLIFPNFISPDNLRTQLFIDSGNVYQTKRDSVTFDAGPYRYSAGVAAQWRSPIGPLVFSLATPIKKYPNDETNMFQFNMGTRF